MYLYFSLELEPLRSCLINISPTQAHEDGLLWYLSVVALFYLSHRCHKASEVDLGDGQKNVDIPVTNVHIQLIQSIF